MNSINSLELYLLNAKYTYVSFLYELSRLIFDLDYLPTGFGVFAQLLKPLFYQSKIQPDYSYTAIRHKDVVVVMRHLANEKHTCAVRFGLKGKWCCFPDTKIRLGYSTYIIQWFWRSFTGVFAFSYYSDKIQFLGHSFLSSCFSVGYLPSTCETCR